MTEQRLQDIRNRLEAATPGPWKKDYWHYRYNGSFAIGPKHKPQLGPNFAEEHKRTSQQTLMDAELISNAPDDIRDLLDYVKELEERLTDLNEWEDS